MNQSRLAWIGILLGFASFSVAAKSVSLSVVVRDHIALKSTEQTITGKLWDSTAGSWRGTRPWIQGLPTPTYNWIDGIPQLRFPLSPNQASVGWPGRIAVRLDIHAGGITQQRCSGALVGPRHVMTAAHCVQNAGVEEDINLSWECDSLYVRPGYNLGTSASGYDKVRVLRSWISKSKFIGGPSYPGDDEWAILELEKDVGTELGWARVVPIDFTKPFQWSHQLGYPLIPIGCASWQHCDSASKTDTLCHTWGPLQYYSDLGKVAWTTQAAAWGGESGSGTLRCADDSCFTGSIDLIGIRWTRSAIGAIDSVMSGIVAEILKDVKVPTASILERAPMELELRAQSGQLQASMPHDGEWQILSLDGRSISAPTFGRNLSVPSDRLPRGVALVVFRAPGQAPITRRWVGR